MAEAEAALGEEEPPMPTEIRIEEYPDFLIAYVASPEHEATFQDWPSLPPPPGWRPPEDLHALHEACAPHALPRDIELAYGPPLPWIEKKLPPTKSPKADLPVREYLTTEQVYDLCLQAMKLAVIERRKIHWPAKWNVEDMLGKHVTVNTSYPHPPPPPPPPKRKEEMEGGGEEPAE